MRYSFRLKEYPKLGKVVIEAINRDTSYRIGFIGVRDHIFTVFADFGRSYDFSEWTHEADIELRVDMLNEQFDSVNVDDKERDTELTRILGL